MTNPTLPPVPSTIANLPLASTPLVGTELVAISQNGVTKAVAANGFTVVGPPGPAGPTGATGATGAAGPPGAGSIAPGTTGQLGYYASNGSGLSPATLGTNLSFTGSTLNAASAATGAMTLLHQATGTSTAATTTTVDTYALASQLTAKDTLLVIVTMSTATQATATPNILNTTDNVEIVDLLLGGTFTSGASRFIEAKFRSTPLGLTDIAGNAIGLDNVKPANATFSTNWTGNWTIGLQHGGVTSGGTFGYNWAIYKIAGE